MGPFHALTITEHDGGRLAVTDPPPVGALVSFSCELLATIPADRGVAVDTSGRLVFLGLVFQPVGFDSGGIELGQPYWIVCQRVA